MKLTKKEINKRIKALELEMEKAEERMGEDLENNWDSVYDTDLSSYNLSLARLTVYKEILRDYEIDDQ
jgi:hypothetical protein